MRDWWLVEGGGWVGIWGMEMGECWDGGMGGLVRGGVEGYGVWGDLGIKRGRGSAVPGAGSVLGIGFEGGRWVASSVARSTSGLVLRFGKTRERGLSFILVCCKPLAAGGSPLMRGSVLTLFLICTPFALRVGVGDGGVLWHGFRSPVRHLL